MDQLLIFPWAETHIMKKNNNKSIIIAIFTIITTIIWIGSNIYHISVNSTISEDMKQVIAPFNPNLDTKIFGELKTKKDLSEFSEKNAASFSGEISPTLAPTETPATNSGQNQ